MNPRHKPASTEKTKFDKGEIKLLQKKALQPDKSERPQLKPRKPSEPRKKANWKGKGSPGRKKTHLDNKPSGSALPKKPIISESKAEVPPKLRQMQCAPVPKGKEMRGASEPVPKVTSAVMVNVPSMKSREEVARFKLREIRGASGTGAVMVDAPSVKSREEVARSKLREIRVASEPVPTGTRAIMVDAPSVKSREEFARSKLREIRVASEPVPTGTGAVMVDAPSVKSREEVARSKLREIRVASEPVPTGTSAIMVDAPSVKSREEFARTKLREIRGTSELVPTGTGAVMVDAPSVKSREEFARTKLREIRGTSELVPTGTGAVMVDALSVKCREEVARSKLREIRVASEPVPTGTDAVMVNVSSVKSREEIVRSKLSFLNQNCSTEPPLGMSVSMAVDLKPLSDHAAAACAKIPAVTMLRQARLGVNAHLLRQLGSHVFESKKPAASALSTLSTMLLLLCGRQVEAAQAKLMVKRAQSLLLEIDVVTESAVDAIMARTEHSLSIAQTKGLESYAVQVAQHLRSSTRAAHHPDEVGLVSWILAVANAYQLTPAMEAMQVVAH